MHLIYCDMFYGSKEMEDLNVASFSCSGKVSFEIIASEEIKSFLIRPASRQTIYIEGGMTEGHSGFSIVCDGPAWVKNIRFEDIRIEKDVEFKNLEFIVTDGTLYGIDPPGHIQ
jgi:hypothetical protein